MVELYQLDAATSISTAQGDGMKTSAFKGTAQAREAGYKKT